MRLKNPLPKNQISTAKTFSYIWKYTQEYENAKKKEIKYQIKDFDRLSDGKVRKFLKTFFLKNNNKKIISKIKLNRTILELKPGDIAVLDPCILHRSHYNFKSSKVRLTNIIRLDDAGDKKHLSLGFKRTEIDKKNINYFKEYNF
jgi:hypothetical protein